MKLVYTYVWNENLRTDQYFVDAALINLFNLKGLRKKNHKLWYRHFHGLCLWEEWLINQRETLSRRAGVGGMEVRVLVKASSTVRKAGKALEFNELQK